MMKRFLSLRFFATLVMGLGLLCLLGVVLENWTGARALAKAKEAFIEEGGTLDSEQLRPKPGPTGSNFLAIEQLAGISTQQSDDNSALLQKLRSIDWGLAASGKNPKTPWPNLNGGCVLGEPFDAQSAAAYLSEISFIDTPPNADAAQVLAAIDRMHPLLKELSDAAVERPEACFDPAVGHEHVGAPYKRPGPYMSGALQAAKGLALRAQFAVAAGDAESAVRSMQASQRFTQALGKEPLLIGLLCAITTATFDSNSIWLLLHSHTNSALQLSRLQADLERLDFKRSLRQAIHSELVWQLESIEWYKRNRDDCVSVCSQIQIMSDQTEPPWYASAVIRMIPAGWFDHNAANVLRIGSDYLRKPVKDGDGRSLLRSSEEMEILLEEHRGMTSPHHVLTVLGFPAYQMIIGQAIYAETLRRQSIAAIALERYRLSHSKLPSTLAELVPEFLSAVPQDPIDAEPMRYRVEGGSFTLWSIARDCKDDGGKRPEGKDAKRIGRADYLGDWVWKN
ncbi:hypothetical protein [Prosthecobacter fluviatilis]|uniref:Uncharacterized protein n=1 Tax=Prosthecobacter fluviatilis TaxID=445931 RepID=A0ABW0KUM8_9BACT